MNKILLVCDKRNWAYDSIARGLLKHNGAGDITLAISYMKEDWRSFEKISKEHDILFFMGWQLIFEEKNPFLKKGPVYKKRFGFLEDERILTGIHSHHAWDKRRTTPEEDIAPPVGLLDSLGRCRGVNAVSRRLYSVFKKAGLAITYTPNGVDTEIFKPLNTPGSGDTVRVGYSGSLKHDWRKGIMEFIEPACKEAGVELKKAMPAEDHYVPLEGMPEFYNDIDVYLCASSSEGFSLSVLEASACGRPVVTTRVGGCEDLILDRENGFFVRRNREAIAEKLKVLKENHGLITQMGRRNREIVEKEWSWAVRTADWMGFIKRCLI